MASKIDTLEFIDLDELEKSVNCSCTAGDDNPY